MSAPSIKLHSKLYRARAIDSAIALVADETPEIGLQRSREGAYHIVSLSGLEASEATELLADLADAALVLTSELDPR